MLGFFRKSQQESHQALTAVLGVTLTTLGYGDVLPKTPTAQVLAMLEVVTGYVMLGGLLSIFSSKMARRAD